MEEMKQLQELYSLKRGLDKNNLSVYVKEASKIQEEIDRIIITYQPKLEKPPKIEEKQQATSQTTNQTTNQTANQTANQTTNQTTDDTANQTTDDTANQLISRLEEKQNALLTKLQTINQTTNLIASAPPINPEYNYSNVSSDTIIEDQIYQYEADMNKHHDVSFETVIQYMHCLKYIKNYKGGDLGWRSMIQMIASYESIEKNRDLVSIYYTLDTNLKKIDVVLVFKHITNSCRKLFKNSGKMIHVIENLKCNESEDRSDLRTFNYDVYNS